MRPLSAIKYIRSCMGKLLPIIITVCLGVAIMYFMVMFVNQLGQSVNIMGLYPYENASMVWGGKKGIDVTDSKKIIDYSRSKGAQTFSVDGYSISYNIVVGKTGGTILMTDKDDIKDIVNTLKLKISEGNLPQKQGEILLDERLAKNYGLSVGTIVKKNTDGWYVNMDLKIAGIYRGKAAMGIGIIDKQYLNLGEPYISLAIAGPAESIKDINNYLDEFSSKYTVDTFQSQSKMLDKLNGPITAMQLFCGVILVCVIGIFIANITSIQYTVRKKELELLHAIGYSRGYIVMKSFKEMSIASLIGYILGIGVAVLIGWIMNIYMLEENGTAMTLILPKDIILMLIIPLCLSLFSMFAPIKLTKFKELA